MPTSFTDMQYDPTTGTTKKKQNPYLNQNEANQGYLPYTGADTVNPNQGQVLNAATQSALAPQSSGGVQQKTTEMTQQLMEDPNMGRDWSKYNTGQMSKFDADRAGALKAYQEANAGMGGSGQVQQGIVDLALSRNLDRGLLENELEQQAYEESMNNYLTALGQGREQGQFLDTSQQGYLNNLLNVNQAYENQRGTNLQEKALGLESEALKGFVNPKGEYVMGSAELAASRFGLESKDLENQTIELFGGMVDTNNDGIPDKQIQGKYDLLSAEDKRAADQLYGYDVTDDNGNVVGRVSGTLQLQNDQTDIQQQGLDLDRAQIMGYDKKNADGTVTHVDGQLDLAMKSQGIDLERLGIDKNTAYGYVQTDENGDPVIGADGNPVRVKGALELQVERLGIEKMLAALEERQVDTAEIQATYDFINNEIDAGRASPNSAMDYLNNVLEDNGVSLTEADKSAIFGEIAQDFKVQQYQFALTNPELAIFDQNGEFSGLTEEGTAVFNNFLGSTLYGDASIPVGGIDLASNGITDPEGLRSMSPSDLAIALRNADTADNQNNQIYQSLAASSPTFSPQIDNRRSNTITMGEGIGSGTVVNVGGRAMVITRGKTFSREGRNHHEFEIMDLATGKKRTFSGLSNTENSVDTFDAWVSAIQADRT